MRLANTRTDCRVIQVHPACDSHPHHHISAVVGLIAIDAMLLIWEISKFEFIACMGAFFGVRLHLSQDRPLSRCKIKFKTFAWRNILHLFSSFWRDPRPVAIDKLHSFEVCGCDQGRLHLPHSRRCRHDTCPERLGSLEKLRPQVSSLTKKCFLSKKLTGCVIISKTSKQ